ncbi:carbamate kinase [Anaeramoeba flamelloides]|uniref:Carbamate kinase n=1 Tax=Anaeramoeba flamelloides TaxID=1746091 RepID=A0ABQ8X3Q2_9EUKA|nr:carbamate kinase [Anaeramoeba flamelloides]
MLEGCTKIFALGLLLGTILTLLYKKFFCKPQEPINSISEDELSSGSESEELISEDSDMQIEIVDETIEARKNPVIVIALGGNALLQKGDKGTIEDQRKNAKVACKQIVKLIQRGFSVHIVHGNGPQAGAVFLQNVNSKETIPSNPLDVVVSETQGLIGYIIQQELQNELDKQGIKRHVATIVTRMEVSADDTAFETPTKPIGKFYTEEEAKELEKDGYCMKEDAGRGWRITTFSPQPLRILEIPVIESLIKDGNVITISCGGGGIPVVNKDGEIKGIEGVIDKDRAGCLLATQVNADLFMILTDVEQCYLDWGKETKRSLDSMTVEEAEQYLEEGHFAVGSMYPKVQSASRFTKKTKRTAIITSLDNALEAIDGNTGTRILN